MPMPRPLARHPFAWLALSLASISLGLEVSRCLRSPGLSWDNYRQLAVAQSLLDGHGLTLERYVPAEADRVLRRPVTQWAPGYSLVIAALQNGAGGPLAAVTLVNGLATLGYVALWIGWMAALLPELGLGLAGIGLAWGLLGVTPLQWLPSADRLTWVAFLGCSLFVYRLACGRSRRRALDAGAAAALGLATAALRYAYWPPLLAYLAWGVARLDRGRRWLGAAAVAVGGAAFVWAMVFVKQKRPEGGPHWANWGKVSPFPLSSFGIPVWQGDTFRALWALAAAAVLLLFLLRRKGWNRTWMVFSAAGAGTTIGLLFLASLVLSPGKATTARITPVGEARYFAPVIAFFVLLWLVKAARGALPAVGRALPMAAAAAGLFWRATEIRGPARSDRFAAIRGWVRAERAKGNRVYWVQDTNTNVADVAIASGAIAVTDRYRESFGEIPPEGAILYFDREPGRGPAPPMPISGGPPAVKVWADGAVEVYRAALLTSPAS